MARTIFQALRSAQSLEDATAVQRLYRPTYETHLRLIGRHLDRSNHRQPAVMEVPGGFLVRAVSEQGGTRDLLEFPDEVFRDLFEALLDERSRRQVKLRIRHELAPTGYQDLLQAIGYRLDLRGARSVLITETRHFLFINGQEIEQSTNRASLSEFVEMLGVEDIDALLEASFPGRAQS